LTKKGFKAVSVPAFLPVEMSKETSGLKGEVSLRHAAQCAGLGEIGLNRLLITPEYGPRVRLGALITNADLTPDKPLKEKLCKREKCAACIKACPVGAISTQGEVNVFKCAPNNLKYFIPGAGAAVKKLAEKNAGWKEIYEFARSPEAWKILQVLTTGMIYNCFNCMTSCPIGKTK
jgi:epoxyqueuosine reductase QueG